MDFRTCLISLHFAGLSDLDSEVRSICGEAAQPAVFLRNPGT